MRKVGFIVLYLLFCFVIIGCTPHADPSEVTARSNDQNNKSSTTINPLILPTSSFHSIIGWLSPNEILYIHTDQEEYHVLSYDIHTGHSRIVLTEEGSLSKASLSPSKQSLLLHRVDSTLDAEVSIFNLSRKEKVWSHVIPSFELLYEWNEHDESNILFTAFESDWTYKVWFADIEKEELKEITGTPPFLTWFSSDQYVYQNWSDEKNIPQTPIYKRFLDIDQDMKLSESVLAFASIHPYLMSVKIDEEENEISYTFDQDGENSSSFSAPSVRMFSDWILPEYDFIKSEDIFVTFKPYQNGVYKSEDKTFALVSWDVEKKAEKIIVEHVNNESLSCSPDGNYCLIGSQFTSIVDMKKGDIQKLLIFKEDIQ